MHYIFFFCTHPSLVLLPALKLSASCCTFYLTNCKKTFFCSFPYAVGGIPKEGIYQSIHTALLHDLHSFGDYLGIIYYLK